MILLSFPPHPRPISQPSQQFVLTHPHTFRHIAENAIERSHPQGGMARDGDRMLTLFVMTRQAHMAASLTRRLVAEYLQSDESVRRRSNHAAVSCAGQHLFAREV